MRIDNKLDWRNIKQMRCPQCGGALFHQMHNKTWTCVGMMLEETSLAYCDFAIDANMLRNMRESPTGAYEVGDNQGRINNLKK